MIKDCKQCGKKFEISDEDSEFYRSIGIRCGGKTVEMSPPTMCVLCRHQRRLASRNEMYLYHRKCDFSGKQIISMYSPDKPYKIYDQHVWWSDDWDPMQYGRVFDFNKSFFEQFKELQLEVPRMCLNNINGENSDYCNLAFGDKSCYLVYTADANENCAYLRFSDRNYACYDCDYTYDSIECYGSFDVEKCNRCFYSQKCINSSGLVFCYNMVGCHDCIGCANLRNKRYFIFNKEYSREEYEQKKNEFKVRTYSGFNGLKKQFDEFLISQPRKYLDTVNCENSLGDRLRDCKNAQYCYDSVGLEDCKNMINCYFAKNCYDWDFVGDKGSINCHEMCSCARNMVNCHFCSGCWENNNELYYCQLCLRSSNLFGCIGLRHKQYCIFNKQYSKEEYEDLVPRIVEHMKKGGGWGEFFPMNMAIYAYNETVADEYFPLKKEDVLKNGWEWIDDSSEKNYRGPDYEIPDNISDVDNAICNRILRCNESGGPYKVIPQEVDFCKKVGLPLPRVSPKQRHKDRMALKNPLVFWKRKCGKCGADIVSSYGLNRKEPVYCEKCYCEIF